MKCSFQSYGTEVIVGDTAVVSVMTEGENQESEVTTEAQKSSMTWSSSLCIFPNGNKTQTKRSNSAEVFL